MTMEPCVTGVFKEIQSLQTIGKKQQACPL